MLVKLCYPTGNARVSDIILMVVVISRVSDIILMVVDGETDCRYSLRTNSMQTSWSVDGETDCRDSLLTNSMQTYAR